MEAVKSCRIPVDAPKDLIDAYFEVKRKALEAVLNNIKFDRRAHLEFKNGDRRRLREELLKNWRYSKHYVDSAFNSIIGLVNGWITLYNRGKTEKPPKITRKTIYIKSTLFSFKNGSLKISIEPGRRYLEIDLTKYRWVPREFDRLGGLILTEKELIITFKRELSLKRISGLHST